MSTHYDFKKEWDKTKKQLAKFSKEAVDIAKKGEKELVKFSKQGKLHIDSTAVTLKKERLFYLIGKEYVKQKKSGKSTAAMQRLLNELNGVNKEQRSINTKLKTKKKKRAKK